jgi:hypothetical protein
MVFRLARAKKNVIQGCSMINEGDAELLAIWMILQLFWDLSKRTSVAACRWISAGRSPWMLLVGGSALGGPHGYIHEKS